MMKGKKARVFNLTWGFFFNRTQYIAVVDALICFLHVLLSMLCVGALLLLSFLLLFCFVVMCRCNCFGEGRGWGQDGG